MSSVPRKILMVKQDPPRTMYVVMMEVSDRTRSLQLSETDGEALMTEMQDCFIRFALKRGFIVNEPIKPDTESRGNAPKRRSRRRA